jgi:hypothetical protein
MRRLALACCVLACARPAEAAGLALHRVMLSAAGVGYFEFGGHVEGSGTLGLDVPLSQVDDVLRSLVVFDDHGGVGSIELPGHDDTVSAFADVPFGAATLNSPADLLASLRGDEVAVSGPASMTGRIVSVAAEPLLGPAGATDARTTPASRTRVTLLTVDGFRQFILEDAAGVRLTDAGLRARVAAALDAARQQTGASTRHLTLRSSGAGERDISIGYVVPAPLWKASYRVVLPAKAGDAARVQGWAVLENQSGADWRGVDLTLHAGNPVTFHQAIYASYYADRPEVPVEVLGRILPDADMSADAAEAVQTKASRRMFHTQAAPALNFDAPPAAALAAPAPAMAAPATPAEATESVIDTSFHIATKIDLARGHSASVPILDAQLPAEQVDWLQPDATRPVTALRLTNISGVSLPAGALTLYATDAKAGTSFAGDARLSGLPAGESRLLAFAEDLRTAAERTTSPGPTTLFRVSAVRGVLHRSVRLRTIQTVRLTAPARDARRVLVEFPKQAGAAFSLEGGTPAGLEETATAWRVPVDLKPGAVKRLTAYIDVETQREDSLLLGDGRFDTYTATLVLGEGKLDDTARARLHHLFELSNDEQARRTALRQLTDKQGATGADEERLRNNLRVVMAPGDLRAKLLAALDADETRLSLLRDDIARAQGEVDRAHAALADAVNTLEF